MAIFPWQHVYFSGCGGVGMAGLAHLLCDDGLKISGSDLVESSFLNSLRLRGVSVCLSQTERLPADIDLFVYSAAVPPDNPERLEAKRRGVPSYSRGAFLALLATYFPDVIAIAGSHGKTSVSAMLTHIARCADLSPAYLIGGEVQGWPCNAALGVGKFLITEVDESDGTQSLLKASLAIINNIDDDHCWSLGGVEALELCFRSFAEKAQKVICWSSANTERVLAGLNQVEFLEPETAVDCSGLPLFGQHNRLNAAIAIQAAKELKIEPAFALQALQSFPGVARRLSLCWHSADRSRILIEDYAHHPGELRACITALREQWPQHTLLIAFQPHRYERIKRYGEEFANLLQTTDKVWVVSPFAAWKQDCQIADPQQIVKNINSAQSKNKAEYIASSQAQDISATIIESINKYDKFVLAIVGAGNINSCLQPLSEYLQKLYDFEN
ncbi:MAG: hypothetical protein GX946_10615 [Oligosphaeraceae bacterium]|nr:hypothetical protein [Oligosphaeraceae bacterium]